MTDSILADDKAIAYGRCLTFPEYCQLQEDRGRLLQMRYAETRLAPARQDAMVGYGEMLYVVALVTDEDPETTAVLPVVVRLTDASQRIQMRILSDEDLRLLTVLLPDLDMAVSYTHLDVYKRQDRHDGGQNFRARSGAQTRRPVGARHCERAA